VNRRGAAAACLLAFFCLAVFGPAWAPGRTLFARDLTYVFHPMHAFSAESLQAGRLPFWNPYVAGGVFWMGDPQTGVFYPGNIFFWLFPFTAALTFFHLFHTVLAAGGAWLLSRSLGGRRAGALAAALVAALNGFVVSRQEFTSLAGTLAWLPALALLFQRRRPLLAPALALAFLAGHTPHFLWTVLLSAAWAGPRRAVAAWRWGMAAIFLAAAQVLPTAAAWMSSDRFDAVSSAAGLHALRPAQWVGWVWPAVSAWPAQAYPGEKFFWMGCFYVGFTGAVLAVLGAASSPPRRRIGVIVLMAVGALLSLGERMSGFVWLHAHLLKGLRYPGQYLWFVTGGSVLLSAAAGRGRRFGVRGMWTVLAFLTGMELVAHGNGFAPTLPVEYFHARPSWVAWIQEKGGRWLLSPRASSETRGEGVDAPSAWTDLRLRLFNLANVPYHVEGLNPAGFAFIPPERAREIRGLYGSPSLAAALPGFRLLQGRWISLPGPVNHPDLVPVADHPWFLYEDRRAVPGPSPAPPSCPGPLRAGGGLSLAAWTMFAATGLHRLKKFL
jgi:hypothetical protein